MLLISCSGYIYKHIKVDELELIIEEQKVDLKEKSTEIAKLEGIVELKDFDLKAKQTVIDNNIAEIKELKSNNEKLQTMNKELNAKLEVEAKRKKETQASTNVDKNSIVKTIKVNASAYTAFCSEGCSGVTRSGYNVSNTIYYQGMRIIASDLSIIPMYSIVTIEGFSEKFIVLDTGGGIKGHKIDILFSSDAEARKFGRKNLNLNVIRYGK